MNTEDKPLECIVSSGRMGPENSMVGVMASKVDMYSSDNDEAEDQDVAYYDEDEDDDNDSIKLHEYD